MNKYAANWWVNQVEKWNKWCVCKATTGVEICDIARRLCVYVCLYLCVCALVRVYIHDCTNRRGRAISFARENSKQQRHSVALQNAAHKEPREGKQKNKYRNNCHEYAGINRLRKIMQTSNASTLYIRENSIKSKRWSMWNSNVPCKRRISHEREERNKSATYSIHIISSNFKSTWIHLGKRNTRILLDKQNANIHYQIHHGNKL